ncbi:MAG: redoxin domain-containing protein [Saprospiraceae bacterium]|nr:redoxin domain-containing protein [Saprospiraceae bacterium]
MLRKLFFSASLAVSLSVSATPAPDFTITDSDGNVRHLYADYLNQGKVVVLEFFFINCPPCAGYAPYWENLYSSIKTQYPGKVEFMMLSNKSGDTNAGVAQYKLAKALTMPAAGANGGSLAAVAPYESGQFGPFYGTPTFIVIEPGTGEVRFDVRANDPISTMSQLRQQVEELLLTKCRLLTTQGDTLSDYALNLSQPGGISINHQVTNGTFSLENFPNLPAAPYYVATPTKNDDPLNGVSTLDLVQINRQILVVEGFKKDWQYTAADANNSGSVTTLDIVELRKLILGVYDSLPARHSWTFSPPWDSVTADLCPQITAIKTGDVNGNASAGFAAAAPPRGSEPFPLLWEMPNVFQAGTRYRLAFRAGETASFQALQAAFYVDPAVFQVLHLSSDKLAGFDQDAWHAQNGQLRLSWFSAQIASCAAGEPLLLLDVLALRDAGAEEAALQLTPTLLPAELYGPDDAIRPLALLPVGGDSGSRLWPNPARGGFFVALPPGIPVAARVEIVDALGRRVFAQALEQTLAGSVLEIRPGSMPSGVYRVFAGGQPLGTVQWQE